MKIQITTSIWSNNLIIPAKTFEVKSMYELKNAVNEVVKLLDENNKNRSSREPGYQPKFNVSYTITKGDFTTATLSYKQIMEISDKPKSSFFKDIIN